MKKTLIIVSLAAITFLFLTILLFQSELPNSKKNGFSRIWLNNPYTIIESKNIPQTIEKICGETDHNIFFTSQSKGYFFMMDKTTDSITAFNFRAPIEISRIGSSTLTVDSPWIYYYFNNTPAIYRARFNSTGVYQTPLDASLFSRSLYISPAHSVLRRLTRNNEQKFQLLDHQQGKILSEAAIVQSEKDMGFSTDGSLLYDNTEGRIIYILHYQNLFFCLDTNLNILYQSHTIDTCFSNTASIAAVSFAQEKRIAPIGARKTVNEKSALCRNKILVVSGLRADNEEKKVFRNNSVIDVYNLDNGNYQGSFHLPHSRGKGIKSMSVRNSILTILQDKRLTRYQLLFLSND